MIGNRNSAPTSRNACVLGAEQPIAEHQRNAGKNRERGEAIERAAGEMPVRDLETLEEGAEDDPLGEGGERRAEAEGVVPQSPVPRVAVAVLEGDAAKGKRQQHSQQREIYRWHDY